MCIPQATLHASAPRRSGTTVYVIRPGDTVESVARRFHMATRALRHLNPALKRPLIAGRTLQVELPMPVGTRRARRPLGVHHELAGRQAAPRAMRRMARTQLIPAYRASGRTAPFVPRPKTTRDRLRPRLSTIPTTHGELLARGVTHGTPQSGSLSDPVHLPRAPGLFLRRPERAWGTGSLVATLLDAVSSVQRRFPGSPDIAVGDLSAPAGGPLQGHHSHQSGLDADVAFYLRDGSTARRFRDASPDSLDLARTWTFIEALLDSGRVHFIFIDHELQGALYAYAKRHASPRWRSSSALAHVFQYPMPSTTHVGVIRHEPNHRDHMHIRIHRPTDSSDTLALR